jgi:hypothetical protein
MVAGARPHAANHGQLVRLLGDVWKEVRNPQAALPSLLELEMRLVHQADFAHESLGARFAGHRLAVILDQLGLVVERVDLAQSSLQKNLHHSICFRRVVWR